jgi:hypothetical protein
VLAKLGGFIVWVFKNFNSFYIQIWLNYFFDDDSFNYITKMGKKKKKKNRMVFLFQFFSKI